MSPSSPSLATISLITISLSLALTVPWILNHSALVSQKLSTSFASFSLHYKFHNLSTTSTFMPVTSNSVSPFNSFIYLSLNSLQPLWSIYIFDVMLNWMLERQVSSIFAREVSSAMSLRHAFPSSPLTFLALHRPIILELSLTPKSPLQLSLLIFTSPPYYHLCNIVCVFLSIYTKNCFFVN